MESFKRIVDHFFGFGLLLDILHWVPAAISFIGSVFAMIWYGARLYEYFRAKYNKTTVPEE